MKVLLVALLLSFTCMCSAQMVRDSINSPQEPMARHYNPVVAGAASYLFPGLGQIYCGETDRGLRFMGAYGGGVVVAFVGAGIFMVTGPEGANDNYLALGVFGAGVTTALVAYFWGIGDAVDLAIKKNRSAKTKSQGISFNYQPLRINHTLLHGVSCRYRF